jgi:hypothetical protein
VGRQLGARASRRGRLGQLLDEEWVAVGSSGQAVDELRCGLAADDGLDDLGDVVPRQGPHVEPLQPRQPDQLRHPGPERVARLELIGAQGHDEQDPLVSQAADEEVHEVAARAVRPVDVLDRDDERDCAGEPVEGPSDQLEQAGLCGRIVGGHRGRGEATPLGELGHERKPAATVTEGSAAGGGRGE